MIRTFIEVPLFSKQWKGLGLNDKNLFSLQGMLLRNPEAGPVMEGTGGIRKFRFAFANRGKSGSARVCYIDFAEYGLTYLITVYQKSEKENLTAREKAALKQLVKALAQEVAQKRKKQ